MDNDDKSELEKCAIGASQESDDKSPQQGQCFSAVAVVENPSAGLPPAADDPSTTSSMTVTIIDPPPLVRHSQSQPGAVAVPGPGSRRFSSGESLMDSTVASAIRESSTRSSIGGDDQLWSEVPCESQVWSEVLINAVLVDEDPALEHSTRDLPFVEATPMILRRQPWYTKMCISSSLLLAVCIIVAIVVALTTEGGATTTMRSSPPTTPPSTTNPATQTPVTLPPSSAGLVDVAVVVQLDENPNETGWSLTCGLDDVMEVLPGTYGVNSENNKIVEIGQVEDGAECFFTIVDSGRNGINDGYFELYFGDDITNQENRLYVGMGNFADNAQVSFTAARPSSASPSAAPTMASTPEPTMAPTSPTTLPSQSPTQSPSEIVAITVVIRLDDKPGETSWRLKCGIRTIYNVPPRNYVGQENRLVTVPAHLEVGDDCEFTIYDYESNGLDGGYFELYSGEDITDETARIAVGMGDFEDEQTIEFTVVAPPTSAPTSSPAPTMPQPPVVPITLVLQLDKFPSEIGWLLQCGSTVHGYVPATTYVEQYQLYTKTFHVHDGAQCTFRITDTYGDGLCCTFGSGSYKLFLGEDTTIQSNILAEGSMFRFIDESVFTAAAPTTSPVHTTSPVSAPPSSAPPTLSETSSTTLAPEPSMVPITVAIQLDDDPEDIGWILECSDNVLVDMYPGTYSEPADLVMETVQVEDGAECDFIITDFYGEGLSGDGYFRIYLGDMISVGENNLLHEGKEFGFQEQFQFTAVQAP